MKKIIFSLLAFSFFLSLNTNAADVLTHRNCKLQVGKKVFNKKDYEEARNALLQRGYLLIQEESDIRLQRPSRRRPSYRLVKREVSEYSNSSSSSDEAGRILLWEGKLENLPFCRISGRASVEILRDNQYPKQYKDQSIDQCADLGPAQQF